MSPFSAQKSAEEDALFPGPSPGETTEVLNDAERQIQFNDRFVLGERWRASAFAGTGLPGEKIVQLFLFTEAEETLRVLGRGVLRVPAVGVADLGQADEEFIVQEQPRDQLQVLNHVPLGGE